MNDVLEYLTGVLNDPGASSSRQEKARRILERREPPPRYSLPSPPTYSEILAAVMLTEGKLKAAELELTFVDHVGGAVAWLRRTAPATTPWLAYPAPAEIAIGEAMLAAGRATAQRFPAQHVSLSSALRHICEFLRLDEYAD